MFIRRFEKSDAESVSALIITTLQTTNIKDYPNSYIEKEVGLFQPEHVMERASWTHFYVVCEGEAIIGCGAIGPYWWKTDESSLFTIFVHPDHQGKGIGKQIIEALERDEFFLRAKRVEIPASITGTPFYLRMGYGYKGGVTVPDKEGLLRLEKYR